MKTLQEKKNCLQGLLSAYNNEFTQQIDRLNSISTQEDYDVFYTDLCALLAIKHKALLPELQLCQNPNGPTQIQKININ